MLEHQEEISKLQLMITDEETKLEKAKMAFKEDSQRFQTFLFESKQVTEKLDEQFKEANKEKRKLEEEESRLRNMIDNVTTDIQFIEKESEKFKTQLEFLNWLIMEFRPRLLEDGKGKLEPLPDEVARRIIEH